MKEFDLVNKDQTKISKEAEIKKENQYLGSHKMKKGHTLFEINTITGEIFVAEYQTKDVVIGSDGTTSKRKSVMAKENCIYMSALNVKNLKRKLSKKIKDYESRI